MRKWMLAGLGLLLVLSFAVGAYAITIENETVATGTATITISGLRGGYKILTVHPWTQDVIVSILDKDGNAIEDYTVEAGSWRNVDISSMGSATIARAVATVVDWGVSVDRDAAIGGSSSQGANVALMTSDIDSLRVLAESQGANVALMESDIDTLRILLAQPEQRTTSQNVLISEWTAPAVGDTVDCCIGRPVSGCRALLLDFEWDAGTEDFAFEYMFGMSAADANFNRFGVVADTVVAGGIDSLVVDESDWPNDHFTYQIPLDGSMAAGYLYTRVYSSAAVVGLTVTVFKVW